MTSFAAILISQRNNVVLILLIIFISLVLYLLFAPVVLEIDTTTGRCRVRYHYLATAGISIEDYAPVLHMRILLWRLRFNLFDKRNTVPRQRQAKPAKVRERKRGTVSFSMIKAVIYSFRVRKFFLAIDTGNDALNGVIYPFCMAKHIEVNFAGRNELALEVSNNAARVLWAVIKNKFH